MTLNNETERRIYDRLDAFNGIELNETEPVAGSIASVLSNGEALADDGEQYDSIQEAVDSSESWTFVGPGTYYENVVIDKDDFTLRGAGRNTVVDGGGPGTAIEALGNNVTVTDITANSSGNMGLYSAGNGNHIERVYSTEAFRDNINTSGADTVIKNCDVTNPGNEYYESTGARTIIIDCVGKGGGTWSSGLVREGISPSGADSLIANCIIEDTERNGVLLRADNSIVIGCQFTNTNNSGAAERGAVEVETDTANCIIANNRSVSGVEDNGTGTVVEGNITGTRN